MPGESGHPVHGRVLPGTAVLISAAVVSLVLGAAALALAWRSYETSVDTARRTAEGYAYEAAVGNKLYLQGRLDLLSVYGTRAAFVLGDPVTAALEVGGVPASAGFDAGVLWYDGDGVVRAGARGRPISNPVLQSEIDDVLATDTARVSPVVDSPELSNRAVVLLVPTHNSDGQPNGVVAGAISTGWLSAQAAQQGELRGTQSFVFDARGTPMVRCERPSGSWAPVRARSATAPRSPSPAGTGATGETTAASAGTAIGGPRASKTKLCVPRSSPC